MTTYFRYAFVLMAFFAFSACSNDNPVEINENTATKIYNEIKGTYEGYVRVGNDSRPIIIVVANDEFTVKRLPLQPILKRIFTNERQLDQALKSAGETTTLKAPVVNISVLANSSMLTMEPVDVVMSVTVDGEKKQVSVLIESIAQWNKSWAELSAAMKVKELFCDGQKYNLTDNGIEYYIDNAKKIVE